MELAREIYLVTSSWPRSERLGLTAQVRRAAVSVPSNIAEGSARGTRKEFLHYLFVARGSLSELDTQVRLACDFGFLEDAQALLARMERIFGLLGALIRTQRSRVTS